MPYRMNEDNIAVQMEKIAASACNSQSQDVPPPGNLTELTETALKAIQETMYCIQAAIYNLTGTNPETPQLGDAKGLINMLCRINSYAHSAMGLARDLHNMIGPGGEQMTFAEFGEQLRELRLHVNAAIDYERRYHNEPGKWYEGTWHVLMSFPPQDEDPHAEKPANWCKLRLDCYLIGPQRHYEWTGDSFEQVLERCRKDVIPWCEEVYREEE